MYRPFLFIGLGGSGGKTLRFLKKETQKWLSQKGWGGDGIPEGWQFLHIDTPTIPDGKELNQFVPMLDPAEYVGLVGEGEDYLAVSNALDNIEGMSQELLGWRIDPVSLTVPIGEGAGQFRAIGRTVAMLQGPQIRQRLKTSFDRIKTPAARAELGTLFSLVNGRVPDQAYPSPVVVIVSSLAGGTGAGLLMNVCDLVEELGEASESLALLYTPEVFGGTSATRGALNPNSLAAISEVLNGHWLHGAVDGGGSHVAVPPRSGRDLQFAGAAQSLSRSGPAYPFLIGMKNASGAAFGTDRALFGMVGAALVSWLTDLGVQDRLIAYTKTNWEGAARDNQPTPDILVNVGKASELGPPAFSALGVATLSIGLEQFEKYAAERIALDAAQWLSRAHAESDGAARVIAEEGLRDPAVLAARIAERELSVFLLRAGLAERDPDDMVINALRPNDADLREVAYKKAIELSEAGSGGTTSGQAWAERIITGAEKALRSYGEAYVERLQNTARQWTKETPVKVIAEVESIVASFGARVGAALVRAAAQSILGEGGVIGELLKEAGERDYWSSPEYRVQTVQGVMYGLGNKVDNRHDAVSRAVGEALHYGYYVGEARLRETAANMLRSFADGFLKPLAEELDGEVSMLDEGLSGGAANWAPWVDGPPPAHLIPPLSEITLIEPNRFSDYFNDLLAETYPTLSVHERRLQLRHEVATGGFLRTDATNSKGISGARKQISQPAVEFVQEWWPGNSVIRDVLKSESKASFKVRIRPEALMERATAWMRRPNSPFADFLGETLRTFLQRDSMFSGSDKPEAVYDQRRRDFVPKLQSAIAASAPLVNLDNSLMGTLHPDVADKPFVPIISSLPFKNHELEGEVRSVLLSTFRGDAKKVEDLMTTDQLAISISVASTLTAPCSPLVISSLLRPIAENWASVSQSGNKVQQFWLRRRARPLQEFIPAPQEHILCMTRGWFIGVLLGIVNREGTVQIGRPRDIPALFPRVNLSKSGDVRDALPLVLESLALAYVEVSNTGTLRPLEAYNALRDLGRCSLGDNELVEFPNIGYVISEWAETGKAAGQTTTPPVVAGTRQERLEKLLETLTTAQAGYVQEKSRLAEVWRKQRSKLGDPPLWPGMEWHILNALNQLVSALEEEIAAGSTGGPVLV